ncbi:MAG: NfeD family protein [Firmicutes bacterium]|nr:NfeD family protein [Bacillota bacterium]
MPNWVIWILIALAFGAVELATVSFFSSLFGLGALVAAVSSLFISNWMAQAIVFIVASVCFVLMLRPIILRSFDKEKTRTNVSRLIGRPGSVIVAIDNTEGVGQVKVDGEIWTARSLTGEPIPVDSRVEVVRIEGVRAVVRIKED